MSAEIAPKIEKMAGLLVTVAVGVTGLKASGLVLEHSCYSAGAVVVVSTGCGTPSDPVAEIGPTHCCDNSSNPTGFPRCTLFGGNARCSTQAPRFMRYALRPSPALPLGIHEG